MEYKYKIYISSVYMIEYRIYFCQQNMSLDQEYSE